MATHPPHTKEGGLNLDEFLCFAIYSAGHAFNQFYRPLLSEIGLTYPQYLAMVSLWSRDGQTVKELGEAMFLESSTLTPLLKRLEALKLVTRRRDPADERQVFIELTAEGRALRARAAAIPACVLDAVAMPKTQVRSMLQDISTIRTRLLERSASPESSKAPA